ncbi:MAG: hypothetical protein ACLRIS_14195 [Flavonifractor plautii]
MRPCRWSGPSAGVLHPEAEAVRALALSGGELAALGLEGPAIGAAQRRLAAHILSHPEDNTRRGCWPWPGRS